MSDKLNNYIDRAAKRLLKWCVSRLYRTTEQRNEFKRQVNNETWIDSQICSGGHSLMKSKPLCDEEITSVMCVLTDMRTHTGDEDMTIPVDYYESKWRG